MDIEQIRTFLAVAANGSFLEAASRLHVTQSTVSARVQSLEQSLGAKLFTRNRAGAALTTDGRRFLRHAKSVLLTLDQARREIGLPSRYRATLRVGGRIALWEDLLPRFVGWLRDTAPDITIQTEIGFEEDLMRRLIEGSLDLGLMYTPQHSPGLEVERLFDETLVLIATAPDTPESSYVHIDWGPAFHQQHAAAYPDREPPALTANIGWLGAQLLLAHGGACYLPERMVAPMLASGRLHRIADAPSFRLPAYLVFPRETDSDVISLAIQGLRHMTRYLDGALGGGR
jgi:LysR family transcriptional regulator, flagellar master operon regulator